MRITKKLVAILMLLSMLFSNISNIVFAATEISEAYLQDKGDVEHHLQYWNDEKNAWYYVTTTYVTYNEGGKEYPAYCMNREYPGVGEYDSYTVDIDSVVDDVRVWRTIINGYPYKSASELGVANNLEAFQATKQAVYCILYNFDPYTRFRSSEQGADSHGAAIRNAIINMVNIGRNGTQTPYTAGISTSKVGNLTKEGNYYVQEFKINCGVDTAEYSILSTDSMPAGGIITNTSGTQKTTFSGNENFKIKIPTSQMNKDINITFRVRGKAKTYPVFYGKTRIAETQNYAVTFDPLGDVVGVGKLNVKTNTGRIQINKTDDETRKPISGVTFQLTKADGTVVANSTTNENGVATFSGLYQDNYKLKEISTNAKYVLNTKEFDVNVEYNGTTIKDITNEHKKGNLKIYKVDKDNHKIALGNVKFDLYSEEFKKVIGTYTTNVDGKIQINNLRIGQYKLIEKNTGKWYNLAEDKTIEVKWNTTEENTIENELKKGQVKVIKVDKDNNEVKLEGVEFEVLDENNKVLEKIVTDKNGEALTSRYPIRDFEKLKIRETKTLETYVLNDEVKTITLKENQIENITFQNEKKKGQIRVIKVDLDNNEIVLNGVKFDVKNDKGEIVDTIVTNKDGIATTKRLPIDSSYTVIEKETKKEYKLTKETQTVTLKQDEIKNIVFKNELKKGQLRVIKVDLDDNEVLLEGVKFDIVDEKGNIVDTVITDENGEATTKMLPSVDKKYTAIEKETRKEYVLTEETQTVELKEDEITSIQFENEKIKGYLEITKVDSKTKDTLKDATFGIYDMDNNEIAKITTDETGKAKSELIPYGKYYAKELDTGSVYYLLNENTFEFEIVKNHETVPLTIDNDSVDIEVTVDKEGTTEIKPGEKVNYEFSNVGNASNVYLENFKWFDYIPTDYIRLETMTTGTWNQDLTYDVYYKTNKSDDYILFKKDLKTTENYDLDFTTIEFTEDEYIVETCFDFGKVDVGFKEDTKPTMECKSFDTLKENDTFTNYTKTVGVYFGVTAEANSKWTTITHIPEEKHEVKLPRTGK